MQLDTFTQSFSTENKKPAAKKFNKIAIVLMLIAIAISMIGIWGEVGEYYSYYDSYAYFGIEFYVYSGWRTLADNNFPIGPTVSLIVTIAMFIASLVLVYVFGIKAFIKGVKNLANNEDCQIFGHFLIIAIVDLSYFTLARILMGLFSDQAYISSGWGAVLISLFLFPIAAIILLYQIILAFDKNKIPEFVGRLFLYVTLILLLAINFNCEEGPIESKGIIGCFNIAASYQYDSSTVIMFTMQGIISFLTIVVSIFTITQTIILIVKGYTPKIKYLIPIIILIVLGTVSLSTNGFALEMLNPNNVKIDSGVINSFIMIIVLSVINLSNYLVVKER